MSFSQNAIGFYLEIEDRLTPTLGKAKKGYEDFTKSLDTANRRALATADKALKTLGKTASLFAGLSTTAVKEYDAALAAIQRRIKPIRQPVELIFSSSGRGKSPLGDMVAQSVSEALGHASFRMHAAIPNRRSRGFDNSNLSQRFQKTMQPPDYTGKFEVQKFAEGGRVKRPAGVAPGKDNIPVLAKENELIINRRSENFIAESLKKIGDMVVGQAKGRGESSADATALWRRMSKSLKGSPDFVGSFGAATAFSGHVGILAEKMEAGGDVGKPTIERTMVMMDRMVKDMTRAFADLAPDIRRHLVPAMKEVTKEVKEARDSARDLATIAGSEEAGPTPAAAGGGGGGRGRIPRRRGRGGGRGRGRGGGGGLGFIGNALMFGEALNRASLGIYGVTSGGIDSQAALAEAMAQQFGGGVQSGRVTAHGFFSGLAGSGVTAQEAFGALNAGRIQGLRGNELTGPMMRTVALAARASGADVGALTDQAALLYNRFNMNQSQVAGTLNRQRQSWQNHGIFGGIAVQNTGAYLDAAEIAASRMSGDQAGRFVGGLNTAYGRLAQRSVFGSDAKGQRMAGHLMEVIANAAGRDPNSRAALNFMGIHDGDLDKFRKSGDPSGILNKVKSFSSSMGGNVPPEMLSMLSGMMGMSPQELNLILLRGKNISNNDPRGATDNAEEAARLATPVSRYATIMAELMGSKMEMESHGLMSGESLGAVSNLVYTGSALYGAYRGLRSAAGLFGRGGRSLSGAAAASHAARMARGWLPTAARGAMGLGGRALGALGRSFPGFAGMGRGAIGLGGRAVGLAGRLMPAVGRRVAPLALAAALRFGGGGLGRLGSFAVPGLGGALGLGSGIYNAYQNRNEGAMTWGGNLLEGAGWGASAFAGTAGLAALPVALAAHAATSPWYRQSQDYSGSIETLQGYLDADNGKEVVSGWRARAGEYYGDVGSGDATNAWARMQRNRLNELEGSVGRFYGYDRRRDKKGRLIGTETAEQKAVNDKVEKLNRELEMIVVNGQSGDESASAINTKLRSKLEEAGVVKDIQEVKETAEQINADNEARRDNPVYRVQAESRDYLRRIAERIAGDGGGGLPLDN